MSEEHISRLTRLRERRDRTADLDEKADLDAAIAALEVLTSQNSMIDLSGSSAGDISTGDIAGRDITNVENSLTQVISDQANVGIAIAGINYGNIYHGIQHTKSNLVLLDAYRNRLITACDNLPIHTISDKKDVRDDFTVSLEQVYTHLVTTQLTTREIISRQHGSNNSSNPTYINVNDFFAQSYYEKHVSPRHLSGHRREELWLSIPGDQTSLQFSLRGKLDINKNVVTLDLSDVSPSEFESLCGKALDIAPLFFLMGRSFVSEIITQNPRLVLLGEPGSGKSTTLRYFSLILARSGLDPTLDLKTYFPGQVGIEEVRNLLPIFLPLLPFARRLSESKVKTAGTRELWQYISNQLSHDGRYQGLAEVVHTEIEEGRAILMLDGLDEVAGIESRQLVVQAIDAFANEYKPCRIIVSCRVRAYEGENNRQWQLDGWPTATLADWTVGQMSHFISAWYKVIGNLPYDERIRRRDDLQSVVMRRPDLQRLGVRPLLLTIMALVHFNDSKLPEERAALYSRCIDILLARWELGRSVSGYSSEYGTLMDYIGLPDADVKSLRPLLQLAAFRAHSGSTPNDLGSLSRDSLRILVADALANRLPNPHVAAQRFLEYTDSRAGILQARNAGDDYVFPHQTFQEYLAGLQLVSSVDFVDQIMSRRTDDRWRAPLFLGIGHAVHENLYAIPYQLLNRLRSAKGRGEVRRQIDILLAAEIAEDVSWDKLSRGGDEFNDLKAALAQDLATVVESDILAAKERVTAGLLLGSIGDPRDGVSTLNPKMIRINGGKFKVGNTRSEIGRLVRSGMDSDWLYDTENNKYIVIEDLEISIYLVTNAQFKLFIDDTGYNTKGKWWNVDGLKWLRNQIRHLQQSNKDEAYHDLLRPKLWKDPRLGISRPNCPVVGVSSYEAVAFCHWLTAKLNDGFVYSLPSESQWEYVARGVGRRAYPWGEDQPSNNKANYGSFFGETTPVGCFLAGSTPEGVFDLAGNVWEWTQSEFNLFTYRRSNPFREQDSAYEKYVLRGGSWNDNIDVLKSTNRLYNSIIYGEFYNTIGFRLVRSPSK